MLKLKCTRELYNAFLQASSLRYSNLALSEVSPSNLSHDILITNQITDCKLILNKSIYFVKNNFYM